MIVQIFDVEHGACALVTSSSGAHMLIDCGHNATTGWRPSVYLPQNGITSIDMLAISNYDEDHASNLAATRRTVLIRSLLRNTTVSGDDLFWMKHEHGMDGGIAEVCSMMGEYTGPPLIRDWGDVTWSVYYNRYPIDFQDENNLSLALFVKGAGFTVLFPGDMQEEGWLKLLDNPLFVRELRNVNVLIAPHHGRADGQCEELFRPGMLWPDMIVVSDKPIIHDTQETVAWYRSRARGILFGNEHRFVFTTRNDGRILLSSDSRVRYTVGTTAAFRARALSAWL